MLTRIVAVILTMFMLLAASAAMAHDGPHDEEDQPADHHGGVAATQPNTQPQPEVIITEADGYRVIATNSIPDHPTGKFPNRRNPNSISPQSLLFRVPISPKDATEPVASKSVFGVALNGIPFEPGTAEYWKDDRNSGWHIEVKSPGRSLGLDNNNAHVQPSGMYHYHGPPTGLIAARSRGQAAMTQLGWAADGYPIYTALGYDDPMDAKSPLKRLRSSWQLKSGERPSPPTGPGGKYDGKYEQDFVFVVESGDLDERNARFGVTPEFPKGTYYYVVTEEFPFISRSFKGLPDRSFQRKGRTGSRPGRGANRDADRDDRRGRGGRRGGPRGPGRGGARDAPPK